MYILSILVWMVPESLVKHPLAFPLTKLYASISPISFNADLSLGPWAFPYISFLVFRFPCVCFYVLYAVKVASHEGVVCRVLYLLGSSLVYLSEWFLC
mgnify:CR=1 FL=1